MEDGALCPAVGGESCKAGFFFEKNFERAAAAKKNCLKSQLLATENHDDSSLNPRSARDFDLAADGFRGIAVSTDSGLSAWSVYVYADSVWRGGQSADPADCVFHICTHFIHAGQDNDVGRAERETGYAIASAVNVYQVPVDGKSV